MSEFEDNVRRGTKSTDALLYMYNCMYYTSHNPTVMPSNMRQCQLLVDKGNVVETLRQRRRNFKDSTSDVFEVPSLEDVARPDFNAALRIEWGLRA